MLKEDLEIILVSLKTSKTILNKMLLNLQNYCRQSAHKGQTSQNYESSKYQKIEMKRHLSFSNVPSKVVKLSQSPIDT